MNNQNGKRHQRCSQLQIKTLVDYMSTHTVFANPKLTGPLGAKIDLEQWGELQKILREQGPDRTIDQWKQTWRDIKRKARTENPVVVQAHTPKPPQTHQRCSKLQIKTLVDYMSTHTVFANSKLTGPLGAKKNLEQWGELQKILREQGPDRTIDQWKQTWRDIKRKARTENAVVAKTVLQMKNDKQVTKISEINRKVRIDIGCESTAGLGPPETPLCSIVNGNSPATALPLTSPGFRTEDAKNVCTSGSRTQVRGMSVAPQHSQLFADLKRRQNYLLAESNVLRKVHIAAVREQTRILKRKLIRSKGTRLFF